MKNSTIKNEFAYKNFIIKSVPWKLSENKGWLPHVILQADLKDRIKTRPLTWHQVLSSKEEAIHFSSGMAIQYIDEGKANNLLSK